LAFKGQAHPEFGELTRHRVSLLDRLVARRPLSLRAVGMRLCITQ